jgi:hypothetical protein
MVQSNDMLYLIGGWFAFFLFKSGFNVKLFKKKGMRYIKETRSRNRNKFKTSEPIALSDITAIDMARYKLTTESIDTSLKSRQCRNGCASVVLGSSNTDRFLYFI